VRTSPDSGEPPLAATVLIATRERPQMLSDTVRSILSARHVPGEIIVVDQSEVPCAEVAELGVVQGCEVRYVHSRTQGLARARNIGLRLASQPTVVILDDDMLVDDDSLERLLARMSDGKDRVVTTGRLLPARPDGPGLLQAPAALVTRSEPAVFRGRQPLQVIPGPNIALPRSVMIEIGGYDERLGPGTRFPGAEDHDLSLRLLDAGCEVRHVPEAVVLHRAWRSQRDLVRLRWGYARGVGGFYAKHASIHDTHTLARAARELQSRALHAARSIISSPKTTVAELITLVGLLFGAAEWSLRYRLRVHRASADK
jgi:GT2 family glycosyltransferase